MGLKKLFLITVLAGAMSVLGCGDDDSSSGNGNGNGNGNGGAAAVCAECDSDSQARIDECVETFDQCIDVDEGNHEECVPLALSRCSV
jgi:hypothetical protein